MADLQIPVQTDHRHRDEAPAAKEEPRPAVETAALPAKQPAVWQAGHNEEWFSCHWIGEWEEGGGRGQKRTNLYSFWIEIDIHPIRKVYGNLTHEI